MHDVLQSEVDKLPTATLEDIEADKAAANRTKRLQGLEWIWADDIEIDLEKQELVDGLLGTTALTVIYGESGCGKTFFAVDMACHIAAGKAWNDKAVDAGPVIYVAAEAPTSVKRRIYAWKGHHGIDNLPIAVVQSSVDFLNGDADRIVALAEDISVKRSRVKAVIIDTLARSMVGDENGPRDMGAYVAACSAIRDRLATHALIVHHSGKDVMRGARGHSSLRAGTDVEIELAADSGTHTAKVTKSRDEAGGLVLGFKLEPFELGTNSHGRLVTTCVVLPVSQTAHVGDKGKVRQRRLTGTGQIAERALVMALAEAGEKPPVHEMTRSVTRAVKLDTWRRYFMQLWGKEKTDGAEATARQAWKRSRESLVARELAMVWGVWAWSP